MEMSRKANENETKDEGRVGVLLLTAPPSLTTLRNGGYWRSVWPSSHPRLPRRRKRSRASISSD